MRAYARYVTAILILILGAQAYGQGVLQLRRGSGTMGYTLQLGEPYVDMTAGLWIGATPRNLFFPDTAWNATSARSGFLKYSDWSLFNSKQPAGTYLIPSDSVSLRNYGNSLYQPLENQRLSTTNTPTFAGMTVNGVASMADTIKAGTAILSTGLGRIAGNLTVNADTTFYASPSNSGFLKYSDWSLFNSKQSALTIGNLSASPPLTQTGGTGAVIGAGVTIGADLTVLATHDYVNNLAAGLFDYDANGDLEPATATVYDAFFTTDANGDIEPKP